MKTFFKNLFKSDYIKHKEWNIDRLSRAEYVTVSDVLKLLKTNNVKVFVNGSSKYPDKYLSSKITESKFCKICGEEMKCYSSDDKEYDSIDGKEIYKYHLECQKHPYMPHWGS